MKKSLSLLVAIAMVVSMFATVVSAADKTAGEKLKDLGIITGTSEGLQEDAEWLRKDVTILLSRLYGTEAEAKATANTHGFADLDAKGYNGYVSWAKTKGLFLGATETTFAPNDSITNYQFATVILRVLGQEQDKYEDNLAKAIELKVLPEGTVGTEKAKRGGIYTALVAALDVEVDGEKLGTKLKLKGYEIVDLAVKSASAVVAKTVVVDFNADVAAIASTDVTVADANGSTVLVEKVAVKDSQATITLATALTSGKEYTVTIAKATGVKAKALENGAASFTYTKGVPASVAIAATTVVKNTYVKYVVKDANGVEITGDFPLSDFSVSTSNPGVVDANLYGAAISYSVVNLTLNADNKVTTGNVTINVVPNMSISVKKAEINSSNTVFKGEGSANGTIVVDVVDQSDAAVATTNTFVSSNPAVLVVNQAGGYTAIQAGTSTVTVTAKTAEGLTASKSFVVTVKEERKATSFSLDKNAVTVVKDRASDNSFIAQNVTVTVLDQYGNALNGVTVEAAVNANGGAIATVNNASVVTNNDGKATFAIASNGTAGSTNVAFKVPAISNTTTQSVSVNSVAKAQASGYAVVVSTNSLDSQPHSDASKAGATVATIGVYVKDVNGNHIDFLAAGDFTTELVGTAGNITTNGNTEVRPVANKVGTQTVNVKVNNVIVSSVTFDVKATSASFASSVVANKSGVTVSTGSLTDALFGNDGALKAVNPQGETIALKNAVNANVAVYSNNTAVVNGSDLNSVSAASNGTAVLTIVVNGAVFTVTVNVQ